MRTPHPNPLLPTFGTPGDNIPTQKPLAESLLNILLALPVVSFFGAGFSMVVGEPATAGAWKMLLMAGSGWIIVMAAAYFLIGQPRRRYLSGLTYLMASGALPLLVSGVLIRFTSHMPIFSFIIVCATVALSFAWMLHLHRLLVRRLNLPQAWTAAWAASLLGTATAWFLLICETDFSCIFG